MGLFLNNVLRLFQAGIIGCDISDIFIGQCLNHGIHGGIFAGARLKGFDLLSQISFFLTGQIGISWHGADALGTVTACTGRCFGFTSGGISAEFLARYFQN